MTPLRCGHHIWTLPRQHQLALWPTLPDWLGQIPIPPMMMPLMCTLMLTWTQVFSLLQMFEKQGTDRNSGKWRIWILGELFGFLGKLVCCWKKILRTSINRRPAKKTRFWGYCGIQTASDVRSGLRFKIYGPNYTCSHVCLDELWPFLNFQRKKEEFVSTRLVGFAASKNPNY